MQSTSARTHIIQHPFASLLQGSHLAFMIQNRIFFRMTKGYRPDWELLEIKRLEQNQSVLVHCVAGMNRSVTICCAVLMLLEGLTAETALERVRQHHPWARPDSHHWLALRWLEMNNKEK